MRLLPKEHLQISGEQADTILQHRAELFVRCGVTVSEFQTLTEQEIAAIIEARDQVRLEDMALLRLALGEHGQAAIDAMANGCDPDLRIKMEQMADRILQR